MMPAAVASKLKCRYTDKGSAFLRLGPVKEEEAYLKPLILIYHDVIYDSEIETIKRLAVPRVCYQFFFFFLFIRWAGHVYLMGEKRNAYRLLVGKPEGKRPLGRLRRRWVDNIKMDLLRDRLGRCGLDWFSSG
jgi:hypothetical protein